MAAAAMDAPLAHVRQRLDALVYDDHSQYLLGSLQHADALFLLSSQQSLSALPLRAPPSSTGAAASAHARPPTSAGGRLSNVGMSIRRRRIPGHGRWARVVGVTPYYVLFALFLGLGWLFQALGVFAFALAFPSVISAASTGYVQVTSAAQSYVLLSFFFVAEVVGAIGFGACADHYGRRPVLLAALGLGLLGEALVALAWNYASLLAFRLVAGLGLGGQSTLLITVALEFSPKRTRGRILVLSQLLGGCGLVVAALLVKLLSPWRVAFAIFAAASLLVAALYARRLRESPKYLASIGRFEQALVVLQGMESAHGIDRQARVTVPSSLYAPPSQQQQHQHQHQQQQRQRSSSRITDVRPLALDSPSQIAYQLKEEMEMDSDGLAPLPLPLPAARRGTRGDSYALPASGNVGRPRASTDRHAAASPAMVSFSVSSSKRFIVLFQSQYLRKTLLLWGVWLLVSTVFALVITCILRHLDRLDKAAAGAYVYIGLMTLPGLVASAALVERLGRKRSLALLLLCSSVLMFVVGVFMSASASPSSLLVSVGFLALFVAGVFAVLCVYTGEHYALMVRAMGIAWALAWGHLGSFIGVYAALKNWVPVKGDAGHQLMFWISGGLCLVVVIIVLVFGGETKGLDIDIIEPAKPEAARKHPMRPEEVDGHLPGDRLDDYLDSDDKLALQHQQQMQQISRYVHTHELSTVPSSPGASFSSASSSSSATSSKFFPAHKAKKTWKKQVRALAAAAASAVPPLRKSVALRKQSTRSTLHADSCTDLDQLDAIVTDGEAKAGRYLRHDSDAQQQRQHRFQHSEKLSAGGIAVMGDGPHRKRTAASDASEPALLDWRPSNPESDDGADPSFPHDDDGSGGARSDSEADKFSIEMDSLRSLSTPMLEGSPQQLSFER